MSAEWYDAKDPLLRCLQQSLQGWEAAVERVLAQAGITATEWRLLCDLLGREGVPQPLAPRQAAGSVTGEGESGLRRPPWMTAGAYQAMLSALRERGWLEMRLSRPGDAPALVLPASSRRRLERLTQAIRALQSVWLAPLSAEERGTMIACLCRMQRQLEPARPDGATERAAAPVSRAADAWR